MFRKPNYKQLLAVAAMISVVGALPTCGVNDPPAPSDSKGGGTAGKSSSGAGTGGTTSGSTTGGSTTDYDGAGIGGSSFDFGGSSGIVGTGGSNVGAAGSGGAGGSGGAHPDGGGAGGSMCGKVTLMINDPGHIPSNLSDLVALINGPNATTEPYPLAPAGGGGHTHLISFNATQVMTLRNGGSVTVMSTATEMHSHSVTVSCTKQ